MGQQFKRVTFSSGELLDTSISIRYRSRHAFRAKDWFPNAQESPKICIGLALAHILLDKGLSQQDLERRLGTAEGLVSKYSLLPAKP